MGRGKYAKVIDQLPRSFGTEPNYQAKIDSVRDQILTPPIYEGAIVLDGHKIREIVAGEREVWLALTQDLIKMAKGKRHASVLAACYREVRWVKEELEAMVSNVNLVMEAYLQLMADQYENEGVTSLTLEDGTNIRVQEEPHAKVVDQDAFRAWVIAEGLERSLQLPWQTTNKIAKDRLLAGEAEPPGIELSRRVKIVKTEG
jgi:hypothetical protein